MVFKENKESLEIVNYAKSLSYNIRKKILMNYNEKKFYEPLKNLLEKMNSEAIVHITHGTREYGKDLVMVYKDVYGEHIIGIIVKTGKIKGDTGGKVDKINSQIIQAYAHDAEIPDHIKPLKIKSVWIVLTGNMTNNAKKRIVNENKDKKRSDGKYCYKQKSVCHRFSFLFFLSTYEHKKNSFIFL